jgi:hypothetical protein
MNPQAPDPTPDANSDDELAISLVTTTCGLVEEYLADFGDSFSAVEDGVYFAKKGSTLLAIHVVPFNHDALVHISANVVREAKLDSSLLRMLLEQNYRSSFGSFGLSPDGTITLRHSLLGSTLEREQLIPAVVRVARKADEWDDKIIALAGGENAVDTLRKQADRHDADAAG